MALLGDDNSGYELARKLDSCGVWHSWLGDSLYSSFAHSLSSPSAWDSFMRAGDSNHRAHIQLQLRARALLFDKAAVSLFLRSSLSSSAAIAKLNPNYLQLHGDDVYLTLEDADQQRDSVGSSNSVHSKATVGTGSRYGPPEIDNISQRFREDFPESWYSKFSEQYRANRPYLLPCMDRELEKRSPSEMFNYLKLLEKHKRRKVEFKEDQYVEFGMQPMSIDDDDAGNDGTYFFPEAMFMMNCVPESAVAPRRGVEEKQKPEFFGVLDMLPQVATKSSIMLERLGIRPEYLSMEQGPGQGRTKVGLDGSRKQLSQEQALQISKKVLARMLTMMGFEGANEIPVEVLSQFLSCHVCKLGRILKVLADSYRKQCSAIELLKMFLQVAGYGNMNTLAELVKDSRNMVHPSPQQAQGMPSQMPTPQQMQGIQSQMLLSHQNPLHLAQQMPRQMHPQPQMFQTQNLTLQQQQQLERMRRPQASTPRPAMSMDKDRPMVEVKLENPSDIPMDSNSFSIMNSRQIQQMQYRQQHMAALQRLVGQPGGQFRQLASQIPSMQTQNMSVARAPPVKVEGFQELMGGDSSLKQNPDDSKLTSPSK